MYILNSLDSNDKILSLLNNIDPRLRAVSLLPENLWRRTQKTERARYSRGESLSFLPSSPRILQQKRDCSQSISQAAQALHKMKGMTVISKNAQNGKIIPKTYKNTPEVSQFYSFY